MIPGQGAVSLSIRCAELVDHVSRLDNLALSHLGQLQDLAISYCKLSSLPSLSLSGLDRLYNLSINTHPHPDHVVSLEIEAGALAGLHHLTSLDLSYSAVWRIPDQDLCSLRSLTFLNISNNNIKDVKDVGFSSEGCRSVTNSSFCFLINCINIRWNTNEPINLYLDFPRWAAWTCHSMISNKYLQPPFNPQIN